MTRKSTIHSVSIGNGLFAPVRRPQAIGEAYRRIQRTCKHEKRDPRGTCYRCGHRMPYEPEAECDCPNHCPLHGPEREIAQQEREREVAFEAAYCSDSLWREVWGVSDQRSLWQNEMRGR